MRVSVIGTAGRKDAYDKLSLEVYNKMCNTVYAKLPRNESIELVSGGATGLSNKIP